MNTTHAIQEIKRVRTGIVGCGRVADHHLKFLSQMGTVEIAGIADTNIDQAKKLGEKYGIKDVFGSLDELLEFAEIDILHIVTPPHDHFEQAVKAIEKGVHVLVEKPIALSHGETLKLYALAEKKGVRICPDYIHLFNPVVLETKAAIREKNLGKLVSAESYMSEDLSDPALKESVGLHWSFDLPGGIIHNYITHPLYLVLDWIGKVNRITSRPRQLGSLAQGLTDHMDIFVDGEKATGKITMTFAQRYPSYYVKLIFTNGIATIDFVTQTFTIERVNGLPRAINRVLINFSRSRQLMSGSVRNVIYFLRKKIVPYHGLKYLIDFFYGWIEGRNGPAVSKELALSVSEAEEDILREAGPVHFNTITRSSTQTGITKEAKVLVTGGSGYVGSEIVRQLVASGYYVRAFVRPTSRTEFLERLGVEVVYGDIREGEKVRAAAENMDVIVHVAAAMKGSKSFMLDCSINGTRNVAEAAREAHAKRVIYISSFSVYDYFHARDGSVLTEESRLEDHGEKRGTYSLAKREAEKIALSNAAADGPAWTILRPSLIFGGGHDLTSLIGPRVGNYIASFGRRGKHLKLIHVEDVASAVLVALASNATRGGIFNISHEDDITVRDLYQKCFRDTHLGKYRIVYVPYTVGLAGIGALKVLRLLLGRGPSMNRIRLAYLCRDILAESSAFRKASGWRPGDKLLLQLSKEVAEQCPVMPGERS